MAERILRSAAIAAASKKLPIRSDRELNETLEWAADSLGEAYRIGAEEAQGVIIGRLRKLPAKAP
jgi:hypothetical protein